MTQSSPLFSSQNYMIPSRTPQLEGLAQIEEMLISRTLPIMLVYLKPGSQRAFSGHCANLSENVSEFGKILPCSK